MNSYNKQALDIIAKEQGFIRDNLEKVMRLVEILNYFHDSPLLSKSLVLKGGTAINLTVFQLPRLSVDIDLDFTVDCDRCHILPAIETHVSIPFLSDVKVRSLSPVELFATKINALIGRSAARDIYDVYNMVKHQLFVSDEEKTSLRKATVFYLTVGSSRKDNATPTEYTDFPQIDKIRFPQIRSQLLPVLRRSEHFDFEKAKTEVKDFLSKLLVLTESEKEYVREFNDKKYIPDLLFEDKEMVNRIKFHPMALWKTRSR